MTASDSQVQPRRKAGVSFILAMILLDMLGVGIIIPILPELIEQFMGGDTSSAARMLGVIASCYAVAQFVFAPILGALSDRFGRRRVLLLSMFGLGVDYLIMGFAPSVAWLFVGRLVAAGLCLINSIYGFFVLPESLAPENRSAFSLGGIAGPAVQGLIAGTVAPYDQGKVQGALTSLMSLSAIVAPLVFTAGLFSYFTSEAAPFELPGAPLLAGSMLMAVAMLMLIRTFRVHPA